MTTALPAPTRVLVVDDSALYRQAICNILRAEVDVEVVGLARDGVEALQKIEELDPDVLTLDVQMPDMDGIQVLREMNRRGVRATAIMVSSLTSEGAQVTTDALLEGAFDFILKPSGSNLEENRRALHSGLMEKIGTFSGSRRARLLRRLAHPSPSVVRPTSDSTSSKHCRAVLIATSTGGPAALKAVLPLLPADLGVPVLVVQHMPARYTKALAGRLDQLCALRVEEAAEGMRVEPGMVLLAPGGQQLRFSQRGDKVYVRVTDSPAENGCKPSADYMFRSAASVFDHAALGVVLTGMGRDGFLGCEILKAGGGTVFSQDEESATVYGMPKAIAEGGLSDRVIPLQDMGRAITQFLANNRG